VVFATVALASASSVPGTSIVEIMFQLDGVQSDFTITNSGGSISGFRVVPLTTGLALDKPKTLKVACQAT